MLGSTRLLRLCTVLAVALVAAGFGAVPVALAQHAGPPSRPHPAPKPPKPLPRDPHPTYQQPTSQPPVQQPPVVHEPTVAHPPAENLGNTVPHPPVHPWEQGPEARETISPNDRPPPGMCRVWLNGVPASSQPAPTSCGHAIQMHSPNGRVIYGDDAAHALPSATRVPPVPTATRVSPANETP